MDHERGRLPSAAPSFSLYHSAKGLSTHGTKTFHPRATSSIIIAVKPTAKAIVPESDCSADDISGISSSTTTYIIAPAAKLRQ